MSSHPFAKLISNATADHLGKELYAIILYHRQVVEEIGLGDGKHERYETFDEVFSEEAMAEKSKKGKGKEAAPGKEKKKREILCKTYYTEDDKPLSAADAEDCRKAGEVVKVKKERVLKSPTKFCTISGEAKNMLLAIFNIAFGELHEFNCLVMPSKNYTDFVKRAAESSRDSEMAMFARIYDVVERCDIKKFVDRGDVTGVTKTIATAIESDLKISGVAAAEVADVFYNFLAILSYNLAIPTFVKNGKINDVKIMGSLCQVFLFAGNYGSGIFSDEYYETLDDVFKKISDLRTPRKRGATGTAGKDKPDAQAEAKAAADAVADAPIGGDDE